MPSTLLFAVNNEGRSYALSSSHSAWREFLYLGLEFKKLSAVPHFIWAIGGDRQVYVHVHSLDVPIRVKEICYENERWYPPSGWSQSLLPTDRPRFSTEDGTVDRDIEKVRLPSMAWQWDGDWSLECTLDGQPLDHDGWQYAVDFPRQYHTKMAWTHCVRRRKWIRFRRYSALNSWCAIAPLHKDPTQEPFIDVSIGGNNVPSASPGLMLVWAVTSHGRVMFRTGVSTTSPEGLKWNAVQTPSEVCQISVGPTGLVWTALHNGRALVRSGVTRECLMGKSWLEVKPPGNGLKITQVAVGTNSVWCVTNDNHVFFRRGVQGAISGISEDAAIGSAWVEMVGNISSISVAANDQVFAVGLEDRALYFRSGVTPADPTGKKWKLIQCQMQMSRTSSDMSLYSRKSDNGSPNSRHRSLNSLKYQPQEHSPHLVDETGDEQSHSAPTVNNRQRPELWQKPVNSPPPNVGAANSLMEKGTKKYPVVENVASSCPIAEVYEVSGKQLKNPHAWSPVRSVGSVVGIEAHPESDSTVFESEGSRDSGVFGEDDFGGSQYWAECDVMWICVAAGAVTVDPSQLPNWFNESSINTNAVELAQPWRLQILNDLKNRVNLAEFENFEKAVEMTSWIKSGEVRAARVDGSFEDCLIELEWVSSGSGDDSDTGTLTILNSDGITTKIQLPLSEITCIMTCSEPGQPRIAIHAPRLPIGSSPIKLQFSGDTDLEDWLSHLTSVCCQLNGNLHGKPSEDSIWATTGLGEVFVFDPLPLKESQFNKTANTYINEVDLSASETPYLVKLNNGMPIGSTVRFTGCVYDDADHIRFDLQSHAAVRLRHKSESFRNVPLHINPRLNEKIIVLNSMEMSNWENEIRDTRMVFSQGSEFEIIIRAEIEGFRIFVNGNDYILFKYRNSSPESISSFYCSGRVKLFKFIYETSSVIVSLPDIFWRQMGGHLRKVETCNAGITWGISYDNCLWSYTGGWGGFLKGLETCTQGINPMSDTHNYYIYENQRWNPISGFSTASLPTDRHLWSDVTGKHKRSKEYTKLLSMHWQWISDWVVDFHTPGGVDRDGWQYAVDFPASYHAKKQFTDYVRRRRWYRKARLNIKGPWQEVGNTRVIEVSLQSFDNLVDAPVTIWAISTNGDVLIRKNVSQSNIAGTSWEHVPCDQQMVSISCSSDNKVWAIGKSGTAFYRFGISKDKPYGESWQTLESPSGVVFKQISAGPSGVWALDSTGRLSVRKEISSTFPEGTHWQILVNIPSDPPHYEGCVGFKCVSVGKEVIATSNSGYICKRVGITSSNPAGTGWNLGIPGNWHHVCANSFT